MAVFTGSAVAIITPFNADGTVNYQEFGRIVDYQIDNGTDAIVVCGTTGEASTLTHEEHLDCISFVVTQAKKRVPVIAGTSSNCTDTAVYMTREAAKRGADAVLVASPYYNKATQNGLVGHFTDIASAVDIPVILYNIPGRTGCNIQPATVAKLVKEVDNIVGIKDASDNIDQTAMMMNMCEGKLELYSGNDSQILPMLSLGGIGVISVLAHVAPKDTHDCVMKFLEGDIKGATAIQLKYILLIKALFSEVNPIPVKKAMQKLGFDTRVLRKPLTEMETANADKMFEEMRKVGIL